MTVTGDHDKTKQNLLLHQSQNLRIHLSFMDTLTAYRATVTYATVSLCWQPSFDNVHITAIARPTL